MTEIIVDVIAIVFSLVSIGIHILKYIEDMKGSVRVNLVLSENQLHYNYYDLLVENLTGRNIQNFKIKCENIDDIKFPSDDYSKFLKIFETEGTLPIQQIYKGLFFRMSDNRDLENVIFKMSYDMKILFYKHRVEETIIIPTKNLYMLHVGESKVTSNKTTYKVLDN